MRFPQITAYLFIAFISVNLCNAQEVSYNKDLTESINTDNHKTLLAAFKATDLEQLLDKSVPFTIFAPSDNAFSKFSQSKLKELLNSDDKNQLETLLKYHIVAGKLTASHILKALCRGKGRTTFTTIQGNKIIATMSGLDIVLTDSTGNSAKITVADSTRGNGVMHEIDSVILPTRI